MLLLYAEIVMDREGTWIVKEKWHFSVSHHSGKLE
jgi:hypothetical protein